MPSEESSLYAHHIRVAQIRPVLFMFIACQPAQAYTFVSVTPNRERCYKKLKIKKIN